MPNSEYFDPLTDRRRTSDELRRLNLQGGRAGGMMWPWILGIVAVIFVVTLVFGYKRPNSETFSTSQRLSSSPTSALTTGFAPASPSNVSPLAATPAPAPATTDSPH
jgi:hypothetical protein